MYDKYTPTEPTGEVDPRLLDFVRESVNTFTRWDLVRFFHHNPHAAEIGENIAPTIGREADDVSAELAVLAANGVLAVQELNGRRIYRLADNVEMRALIAAFVAACDSPAFRMQAIQYMIEQN